MNILLEANDIIHGDREKTHGDPGRNLREIAAKWSVTLGVTVTPEQVAICMVDLKTVRAMHDPGHRDHWVDIAGYAGLVDRCGFLRDGPEDPEALYHRNRNDDAMPPLRLEVGKVYETRNGSERARIDRCLTPGGLLGKYSGWLFERGEHSEWYGNGRVSLFGGESPMDLVREVEIDADGVV